MSSYFDTKIRKEVLTRDRRIQAKDAEIEKEKKKEKKWKKKIKEMRQTKDAKRCYDE